MENADDSLVKLTPAQRQVLLEMAREAHWRRRWSRFTDSEENLLCEFERDKQPQFLAKRAQLRAAGQPDGLPLPWLRKTLVNYIRDRRRSQLTRRRDAGGNLKWSERESPAGESWQFAAAAASPTGRGATFADPEAAALETVEHAEHAELLEAVAACFVKLSESDRWLLWETGFQGRSLRELARDAAVPEGTLKVRKFRAIRKLRDEVKWWRARKQRERARARDRSPAGGGERD